MSQDDDALPEELREAFAQREKERAQEAQDRPLTDDAAQEDVAEDDPTAAPSVAAPSPAEPPSPPRRAALRPFLLLPLGVAMVALVAWLGLAGWRAGTLLVAIILAVVLLPTATMLTRGVSLRPAYMIGVGLIIATGLGVAGDAAPWSHGRIEERLEKLTFPFATSPGLERSGHGWCSPACPTVVRELRVEGKRSTALYETAVVALDAAGFVPKDARRSFLSRALSYKALGRGAVIDHQSFTTVIRLRDDGSTGVVRIEVTSRRGFKEQPDPPRSLPG